MLSSISVSLLVLHFNRIFHAIRNMIIICGSMEALGVFSFCGQSVWLFAAVHLFISCLYFNPLNALNNLCCAVGVMQWLKYETVGTD